MKSLVMLMVCMTFLVQCHLYAEEQDDAWISFIDEIAKYRNEDTNHIYYAGSSNDIAFLYHRTSKGIREWQINKIHLLDTVRRPFSHDNKRWIIIKTDTDEKISYLDIKTMTHDFIRRLPSESALVKAADEFFVPSGNRHYKDGTPMLICRREYKVIATNSGRLHKDDIVCTSWPVDDYTSTTNILSNRKEYQRHTLADDRTLYVTWDAEMLRKGNTDGYFYIGDVFAAPMELVWDSDIKHEALVPFDEKMTIDTYVERATNLSAMRADAINKFISDKLTDYCLAKITRAYYKKGEYNGNLKMHNVLLVLDGIIECGISKTVLQKLPKGTLVRSTILVDDKAKSLEIMRRMNGADNIAAEKSLGYAFFYETPPPEGEPNIPVAGWFDDPIFIWQGSESYNPDIPIEEVDIVEAFRKRAVKAEQHSRGN